TLHVAEVSAFQSSKLLYMVPTLHGEDPELADAADCTDFFINLEKDTWRQVELYPESHLPILEKEMNEVVSILFSDNTTNVLEGYKNQHIRKDNPSSKLS